jgi:hypothetical protein
MFSILLIEPNNLDNFNVDSKNFNNELNNFVTIEFVSHETMMQSICSFLKLDHTHIANTVLLDETPDRHVYQLCYLSDKDNKIETRGDNKLASMLTYMNEKIDGPAVIVGSRINIKTGIPKSVSVNYETISLILKKKFFHNGLYVHSSGRLSNFIYYNDLTVVNPENSNSDIRPMLGDIVDLIKNGAYYEYSLYKYNLVIVMKPLKKDELLKYTDNKIMTIFLNNMLVKGNCLILHKVTQNDYTDITLDEFKQMVYLYTDKNLDSDEISKEKVDGIYKIKNKHMILYNKFRKYRKNIKKSNLMDKFDNFVQETFSEINKTDCFNTVVLDELNKKDPPELKELLDNNNLKLSEKIDITVNEYV